MVVALGSMLTGLAIAEPRRISADELAVDAKELARTLNLFLRDDDAVTVDKSTNSILIAEQPPEVTATIDALIDEIRPARDSGCCLQEAVPLRHADAGEVARLVREYFESDDLHVHAITRTNSVLVIARPELAEEIKERIRAVDESQRPDYAVFNVFFDQTNATRHRTPPTPNRPVNVTPSEICSCNGRVWEFQLPEPTRNKWNASTRLKGALQM